ADVEGMQFAINTRLADAACDQLRVLRAEVENEDLVVSHEARARHERRAMGRATVRGPPRAVPFMNCVSRSIDVIVWRFLDDLHIMDVRLAHAGTGYFHKLGPIPDFADGCTTEVPHCRTQPSHELMHHLYDAALVGDAAFHTLGHQLVGAVFVVLEVAVA